MSFSSFFSDIGDAIKEGVQSDTFQAIATPILSGGAAFLGASLGTPSQTPASSSAAIAPPGMIFGIPTTTALLIGGAILLALLFLF